MELPKSILRVIDHAVLTLKPKKIMLFGSRARGDAKAHSDFDLAFFLSEEGKRKWSNFVLEVEEEPISLLKIDLVDFDRVDKAFKEQILKEGIALYESS